MTTKTLMDRPDAVIPNPDPSVMTIESIDRSIRNLDSVINARISGMEKAVEVFQSDLTRVPTQLDRGIGSLRDLVEARLLAITSHMESIKEITLNRSETNQKVIGTRLDAMDKAIELLQASAYKMPAFVKDQVDQLHSLTDERFSSIDKDLQERDKRTQQSLDSINVQFAERDKRTEQLSLADKTAIAAALQAQKEAAGATNESNGAALAKMENNFTKQIEAGQALVQSVSRNLEDKLNDLKSRMDRGEGKSTVLDPAIGDKLDMLSQSIFDLNRSRDQHTGSEKHATDSSARTMAGVGLIIALAVGIGEIIVRVAVH
jgi:hypothetical protein